MDELMDQVRNQFDQVRNQFIWGQICGQVGSRARNQILDQIWSSVLEQIWDQVMNQTRNHYWTIHGRPQ